MKEKSIVIKNFFAMLGMPPIVVTVHEEFRNGKGIWVDDKGSACDCQGNEYGPSNEIPYGWDLVTPDDQAEFLCGAKLVRCWEHNFEECNNDWLAELPLSPAYIYGRVIRGLSGELTVEGCSTCHGFETNEPNVLLELFAIALHDCVTKEALDLHEFLQRLEARVKEQQKMPLK